MKCPKCKVEAEKCVAIPLQFDPMLPPIAWQPLFLKYYRCSECGRETEREEMTEQEKKEYLSQFKTEVLG